MTSFTKLRKAHYTAANDGLATEEDAAPLAALPLAIALIMRMTSAARIATAATAPMTMPAMTPALALYALLASGGCTQCPGLSTVAHGTIMQRLSATAQESWKQAVSAYQDTQNMQRDFQDALSCN